MTRRTILALCTLALLNPLLLSAQEGSPGSTQFLVRLQGKTAQPIAPNALSVEVDRKTVPLTALTPVQPADTQIALLIDDGLRSSIGRQLDDLRKFIQGLPQGTEVLVGYMQNGRVASDRGFTSDLGAAASQLRLPFSSPGLSASPYICVSDFVKRLPREPETYGAARSSAPKARFILMLTNGVDPYNGSVSPLNQNSPYVDAAATDAQRAGIPVYAIYYGDAGIRGGLANFSGQSYLAEVTEKTGGVSLYNGRINPVDLLAYLKQFQDAVFQSYIATFATPAEKHDLASLRVRGTDRAMKPHAAQFVRLGARIGENAAPGGRG